MNITITKSTNASTSYGDRGMAYHNPGKYSIFVDGNLVGTISGQAGNRGRMAQWTVLSGPKSRPIGFATTLKDAKVWATRHITEIMETQG